ncbi:putative peptidoglycan glycosyltransferase FtsW [bacterium HR34]|nr:putative peptidoglycan glycosyltransferase FtsW [bacterium HR34]
MLFYSARKIKDNLGFLKNDYFALIIIFIVALLSIVGILAIYSASAYDSFQSFGNYTYFLNRHLAFIGIGVLMFFIFYFLNLNIIKNYSFFFFLAALVFMFFVFLPGIGQGVGESKRWVDLRFISVQPSEFLKPLLLIYVAAFFSKFSLDKDIKKDIINIKSYFQKVCLPYFKKVWLPFISIISSVAFAFYFQKDAGTFFLIAAPVAFMFLITSAPKLIKVLTVIIFLIAAFLMVISEEYRIVRIQGFFNSTDILSSDYQSVQSLISMGSGGLLGQGIGAGFSKTNVPLTKNDFIFSVIGEEMGFLGSLLIVTLFIIFMMTGFLMARRVDNIFNKLLIYGIVILLSLQAMINIQSAVGGIVKGIPLPFISYGGSATITAFSMIGLLLNAYKNN